MITREDPNPELFQSQKEIMMRQHYYFLGKEMEDSNNLKDAIEAYLKYSDSLKKEDQHIPHKWIAQLYFQMENFEDGLIHLGKFAEGCSPPKAAEEFKMIGENYEKIGNLKKALESFERATDNNPQIGLKKKIQVLKGIELAQKIA